MPASPSRRCELHRATKETDIKLDLKLDGTGNATISSGVGFLDHMLTLFTVHGQFDLHVEAKGDTDVDDHHTVEDLGICLGQAIKQCLDDMSGICRYGHAYVPMDEALARVCLDVSNRPYLQFDLEMPDQKVGTFDTSLAKEFFRALSLHAGLTMHVDLIRGENSHHILEAVFKALARALAISTALHPTVKEHLSSKGTL